MQRAPTGALAGLTYAGIPVADAGLKMMIPVGDLLEVHHKHTACKERYKVRCTRLGARNCTAMGVMAPGTEFQSCPWLLRVPSCVYTFVEASSWCLRRPIKDLSVP